MAGTVYGRIAAYEAGGDGGGAALRQGLRRNLFATVDPDEGQGAAMAPYRLAGGDFLKARSAAGTGRGAPAFPSPGPPRCRGKALTRRGCFRIVARPWRPGLYDDEDPYSAARIFTADRGRPDRAAGGRAGDRRQCNGTGAVGGAVRSAGTRWAQRRT